MRVDDEERGLRELRQPELGARIVNAQLANRIAKDVVGLNGPVGNRSNNAAAHALRLGSLTRKETRCGQCADHTIAMSSRASSTRGRRSARVCRARRLCSPRDAGADRARAVVDDARGARSATIASVTIAIAGCLRSADRWRARWSAARSAWRPTTGAGARVRTAVRRSPRPATDLHFNCSHSAGLVVCALGARPRARRGRRRSRTRRARIRRWCPATARRPEAEDVAAQGDGWRDRFLTYWTLKEAYLKARGLGISVQLADISFALNGEDHASMRFSIRWRARTIAGGSISQRPSRTTCAVIAVAALGRHQRSRCRVSVVPYA